MTGQDCNCDAPMVSTAEGMRCTECGEIQEEEEDESGTEVMNG